MVESRASSNRIKGKLADGVSDGKVREHQLDVATIMQPRADLAKQFRLVRAMRDSLPRRCLIIALSVTRRHAPAGISRGTGPLVQIVLDSDGSIRLGHRKEKLPALAGRSHFCLASAPKESLPKTVLTNSL
jgi:hypothetical protein